MIKRHRNLEIQSFLCEMSTECFQNNLKKFPHHEKIPIIQVNTATEITDTWINCLPMLEEEEEEENSSTLTLKSSFAEGEQGRTVHPHIQLSERVKKRKYICNYIRGID